jgi:hypothetical protein
MFILYAVVIGLAVGFLLGGRPRGLADLRFRWPSLMVGGLLLQVVLFSDQVTSWIGSAGPPIYVASTAAVFLAVLASRSIAGLPIVAVGAACNLAAIVANGGYMPVGAGALQALGKVPSTAYSNSAVVQHAALAPLTDIFALPAWLPYANVFSVGDAVIAVGVVLVIVAAMRREAAPPLVEGHIAT